MFEKLQKGKKKLSPVEKDAKVSVLKAMKSMAESSMGEKLKGLKKVSVMSDSPKGLEKGLEKAKELIGSSESEEASEEESEEMHEEEMMPSEMSEEEIDEKIKELIALKEQLKSKE